MKGFLDSLTAIARYVAALLALGAAAVMVLAQGGRFSDRLDVLTHFAPIWLAIAAAAAVLWFVGGRRGKAVPMLIGLAFASGLLLVGPEVLAASRQERFKGDAPNLKIVQFNLWGRNRDPEETTRWILAEDPDVIVFEEGFARSGGVARALAPHYPHTVTCADPLPCSTMILSKRAPIDGGGLQGSVSETNLSGAWATFKGRRGEFTVVGVHYTWPLPAGPQQQQTKRLGAFIERFPKESLVVAGDMNSTPWSFSLKRQDKLFGLERRTRGLFSWPAGKFSRRLLAAPFPFLAIDQVYAGAAWKTVSVKRGPKLGSDHYPVVVELARP